MTAPALRSVSIFIINSSLKKAEECFDNLSMEGSFPTRFEPRSVRPSIDSG